MATAIKTVTIEIEGEDYGMAIARALDLFNEMNVDGITLHWIGED